MKIALAQTRPIKGDIPANIVDHLRYIDHAASVGADAVFFSELSLTGYEPMLAHVLATDKENNRFHVFQERSNSHSITLGIGVPMLSAAGIWISMLMYQPGEAVSVYSKKYLHPSEEEFFVPGENITPLTVKGKRIAPAICYELSIPDHPEQAVELGADLYLASVAKTTEGTDRAYADLSETAKNYGIPALMVNCVGPSNGNICVGRSAVWDARGELLTALDEKETGLLVFDLDEGTTQVARI